MSNVTVADKLPENDLPVTIEGDNWIGANATIVCGHDIGKFAFIGAGSVVTKTVQDYALVVGNPAKQIGFMSEFGHRLEFNENGIAVCPESNHQYKLENEKVTRIK